jgi:hypothetical protein
MRLALAAGGDGPQTWEGNDSLWQTAGEQRPGHAADTASSRALPNPWTWTAAGSGKAHLHGYWERDEREEGNDSR